MSSRLVSLCLLTAVLALPVRADPVHPIYARLKAGRNYFILGGTSPMSHRFTAWLQTGGYVRCEVGANTPDEVWAADPETLEVANGGMALPPSDVDPVPEEVRHLAEAFENRLGEIYPDMGNLQIAYTGRTQTFWLSEITPFLPEEDPSRRGGIGSDVALSIREGSDQMEFTEGIQLIGGIGRIVPFGEAAARLPTFLDFQLPDELVGLGLCRAGAEGLGGAPGAAWKALTRKNLETARARDKGTYVNPIEAILTAQGDALLPPGLDMEFPVQITAIARAQDPGDDTWELPGFQFRLREVLGKVATRHFRSEETGIDIRAVLDLAGRQLTVEITPPDQPPSRVVFGVQGEVIQSEDSAFLADGYLSLEPGDVELPLRFPASGGFTGFDVFVHTMLFGRPLRVDPNS